MLILVGYVVILLCVFGGFALSGGHLAAIFQPLEFLIIGGAAFGALIVGNSFAVLKTIARSIPKLFRSDKASKAIYLNLLGLMYTLLNKGRQHGMMSIESDIEDPANSPIFNNYPQIMQEHHVIDFICDYFRLMITSSLQSFQLEALMDMEMESHHEEEMIPAHALTKMADGLPAFGIVAAVLGVVHTMESISLPPAELGILVAHALVGTFLGILIGYGFVAPVANLMEQRANKMQLMYQCVKATLIASLNNNPPLIAVEYGRKVLFLEDRPSFTQMNDVVKNVKQSESNASAPINSEATASS